MIPDETAGRIDVRDERLHLIGLAIAMRDGGDILALGKNITTVMNDAKAELPLGIDWRYVDVETQAQALLKVRCVEAEIARCQAASKSTVSLGQIVRKLREDFKLA